MYSWSITTFEPATLLGEGSAPDPVQAWIDAIEAVLGHLEDRDVDGCVIVMDGAPAWLRPGRTDDGQLDAVATRVAAERMAMAATWQSRLEVRLSGSNGSS